MEEWMEVTGNMLKIRAPEELDHHSAEHIRRESDEILARNNIRQIVFDFQKTVFMDSSGIGVIMGRYRNIRLTGGTVKAVHVTQRSTVERILRVSGIHKVIEIEKDPAGKRRDRE